MATSGGNLASPLLAEAVGGGEGSTGGAVLLALISAVAFATILAVVAGLTLTSASSVAHDLYATVFKRGQAERAGRGEGGPDRRLRHRWHRRSRWPSRRRSSTSPSWWRWPSRWRPRPTCRRCSTTCSGGGSTPAGRCGPSTAAWSPASCWCSSRRWSPGPRRRWSPAADWAWFPLSNPGIISIPAGLPARLARHRHLEGAGEREALHRARGPLAHRRGLRGRDIDLDGSITRGDARHRPGDGPGRVRQNARRQRPGGLFEGRPGAARLVGSTTRHASTGRHCARGATDERRVERHPGQPVHRGAPVRASGRLRRERQPHLGGVRRRRGRPARLLGEAGRSSRLGDQVGPGPRLGRPAVREVVRRRQAQRRLQLRRPARRERRRRQGRLPLGGRARGRHPRHHLRRAQGRGVPGRQRAGRARRGDR